MTGPPLAIEAYEKGACASELDSSETVSLAYALLGLVGETGSLLSEVKKKQRDAASYGARGYHRTVVEEVGDVLWYLSIVARRAGGSLSGAARAALGPSAPAVPDFGMLQRPLGAIALSPTPAFERALLELTSAVGMLVAEAQAVAPRPAVQVEPAAGAVLITLARAASEAGVLLSEAASANLEKITGRWPARRRYPPLKDASCPPYEQLPRYLEIDVFEETLGRRAYVYQRVGGLNIGDRLTDNIEEPDDYRFHDVFHYAYAAVLGWSPVLRSLFRVKRKSESVTDEAQDGARAILLEEGLTAWIFNYAKMHNLFDRVERGQLSFSLLKAVPQFVAGFEPDGDPLWLWEEAILQGYTSFRFLKAHRRGRVTLDLEARRLTTSPLP